MSKSWQRCAAVDNNNTSRVDQRLAELLEGRFVLVNIDSELPSQPPPWFDPQKFRRGQLFFRNNFYGIFLAKLCSLLLLLLSSNILKVLIFTRKSETPWKAFRRYVGTVVHVYSWYAGNVWEEGNPARKSLHKVKMFHSRAARMSNDIRNQAAMEDIGIKQCGTPVDDGKPLRHVISDDSRGLSGCPHFGPSDKQTKLYVNQYDMAITQFSFLAMTLLFPDKFGVSRASRQDLEGLIHFWRCIGYLLGIEDRFNFCAEDNLDFTRELGFLTLHKCVLLHLRDLSEEYEHMTRAIAKGLGYFLPGFSFESLFLYIFWAVDVSVPKFTSRVPLGSYIHFNLLRFFNMCLLEIPGMNHFFNFLLKSIVTLVVQPPSWLPRCFKPSQVEGLGFYWSI